MRILFLCHRLPYPPNKGDRIRSFWELRTLAQKHEVDLFCFADDRAETLGIPGLEEYCSFSYAEPLSFTASRLRALQSLVTRDPFSKAFYFSQSMAAKVDAAVRSRNYDLIFVFSSSMAQYAEPWCKTIPTVLDLVDVDSDKWTQYAQR